jgi:hypothetical protein
MLSRVDYFFKLDLIKSKIKRFYLKLNSLEIKWLSSQREAKTI